MKIFYIAEITGKVGIWTVKKTIGDIKKVYNPDFIIANANRATGGSGLGKEHANYLKKMGVDCITGGDCMFQKQDLVQSLAAMPFVLRPANISQSSPGSGYHYFFTGKKEKLAVISLLGRYGRYRMLADNPFSFIEKTIQAIQAQTNYIFVDFSSSATAEKKALAYFLAGKVSALIGSGAHAATADEQLLYGTTAFITDAGRTGSFQSVGGYVPAQKIEQYRTGLFEYPYESWDTPCLQGLTLTVDECGKAQAIGRVRIGTEVS
ncbi:MAG: TIGR00282 family metallophosphoesterase [Treponema sp.]